MAKKKFPVYDYLKKKNAVGSRRALSACYMSDTLRGDHDKSSLRALRDMVKEEILAGAPICSTTAARNGYFLPENVEEAEREIRKNETAIKLKAARARSLRQFVGRIKSRESKWTEGPDLFGTVPPEDPRFSESASYPAGPVAAKAEFPSPLKMTTPEDGQGKEETAEIPASFWEVVNRGKSHNGSKPGGHGGQ